MLTLADILPPDGVQLHISASSLEAAVEQLSLVASEYAHIQPQRIRDALVTRALDGISVGGGAVIAHARMEGLRRFVALFARPVKPIPLDDGSIAECLFIILAPQDANQDHLRILSQVAGLLRNSTHHAVLKTGDKHAIYHLLCG